MKPGYKTTEFWLTLLVTLLSAIMPVLENFPVVAKVVGLLIACLAALGYTTNRTSLKSSKE